MTRKGKQPITLPSGVTVECIGNDVKVKGAKGELTLTIHPEIRVNIENSTVTVTAPPEKRDLKKFHGLYRTLIFNMVTGVEVGFIKNLEMIGVGYRAAVQGRKLNLQVGFSHPTEIEMPEGLEVEVQKNTLIIVKGIDKQKVGQFAATIRSVRPPEPYQGKGIRYSGEYVRRKAGKSAAKK